MTNFLDGPAEGHALMLKRRPIALRVVVSSGGEVDALDQPEDRPEDNEVCHLYILAKEGAAAFIDGRDPKTGKRWGGRYMGGDYRLFPDQPEQDVMRRRCDFVEWCQQNLSIITATHNRFKDECARTS